MTFTPAPVLQDISMDLIDPTGGTQMRVRLEDSVVLEYAERMAAGDTFPPIVVFQTGKTFRLADGFHRFRAARNISARTIRAEVHVGTLGDAIEYAVGANKTNGLRRTNADKQMAVRAALSHERLREMSDRAIAELAGVSHPTVAAMRRGEPTQVEKFTTLEQVAGKTRTRTGTDGKEYRLPRNETRPPVEERRTGITQSSSTSAGARPSDISVPAPMVPRRAALLAGEVIECPHCKHCKHCNGTRTITGAPR